MDIIGRKQEKYDLQRWCESKKPEFIAVYGRRRVGKTFLVREYFNNEFAFYATGIAKGNMHEQLRSFGKSLRKYGGENSATPTDWIEAFEMLEQLLLRPHVTTEATGGKKVVFIDELPWFDTPRSGFKQALELFWNGWASAQPDILLIVCGSATSWVIKNLLKQRGGFHNRITGRIYLEPFTLAECEAYYRSGGYVFSKTQIIESYMTFGGIPYYLDLMDSRQSLAQNIERLCFTHNGALIDEFDELYHSLFRNSNVHLSIVRALSKRLFGMTRNEIEELVSISSGGTLTKAIEELIQCGFVRRYANYVSKKNNAFFQLIDPFSLFYLRFIDKQKTQSWLTSQNSGSHRAWSGLAFEMVCQHHVPQIKAALGISGVETNVYSWKSSSAVPGAQIDLVLDRGDGIINLCEIKYTQANFSIDKTTDASLRNKVHAFIQETETKKAVHLTLITPYGLAPSKYNNTVQSVITADDLFS